MVDDKNTPEDDNNTVEDDNHTEEEDNAEDFAAKAVTVEEDEEHQENIQRINTVEQSLMKDIQEEDSIEELIQVNNLYINLILAGVFKFPNPFLQINEDFSLEEAVSTTEENTMENVTCNFNDTKNASPEDIVGVSENVFQIMKNLWILKIQGVKTV